MKSSGGSGCAYVNGKQETARRAGQAAAGKLAQRAWVPHPSAKWDMGCNDPLMVQPGAGKRRGRAGGCGGGAGGDMSTNISNLVRQAASPGPRPCGSAPISAKLTRCWQSVFQDEARSDRTCDSSAGRDFLGLARARRRADRPVACLPAGSACAGGAGGRPAAPAAAALDGERRDAADRTFVARADRAGPAGGLPSEDRQRCSEAELRCRVAVASTLFAGLELARNGALTLEQDADWTPIRVSRRERDVSGVSAATPLA